MHTADQIAHRPPPPPPPFQVSELIHKSDGYPALEFCRVAVHFVDIIDTPTDDDHYTEVPGTGLVVSRIAYTNNSSK